MREKYESLSVTVLREVAKARGLRHLSGLKKSQLVELMLEEDEKAAREGKEAAGQEQKRSSAAAGSFGNQEVRMSNQPEGGGNRESRMSSQSEGGNREGRMSSQPEGGNREGRMSSQSEGGNRESRMSSQSEGGNREGRMSSQPEMRGHAGDGGSGAAQRIVTSDGIEIENPELDSGVEANGILEVMPDGYGFIRCENYMPGEHDVYVSPSQIRRFNLKTGDIVRGNTRIKTMQEKFSALLFIRSVNGFHPREAQQRPNFEDLTPIFPNQRIRLETHQSATSMRIMDLVSPIGKGQRGMIVSQPKAGKTTLLKEVAKAITKNNPQMHLIILLIDERPEEVTDIKEAIEGKHVEVIYSTFDELPEHHKRVSEMVIERARRLVEHKKDVMILLDSITRLARAYNLIVPPSGRTLSGGIDPAALHMPKRFFGAARNMREGGSLTILATALVDTGSRMDDVIYEEFKGTGNMELILDRKLSEKRVFPAIDITKSGTRREDLLLDGEEREAVDLMRRGINGMKTEEAVENIMNLFVRTRNNREFAQMVKKTRLF